MAGYRLFLAMLLIAMSLAPATEALSNIGALSVEKQLTEIVKDMYSGRGEVAVKVEKLPIQLREGARIQGIEIVRLPEPSGAGLALIQYKGGAKVQSSYVTFRTYEKKRVFYARRNMKKGERIEQADTDSKVVYVGKKAFLYPDSADDLRGKVLKRNVTAGSLITNPLLEEPQAIKRGQTLTIVAQNKRLVVQAPGKATESGRRGDFIRVRSLSSGKELQARVIDNGTVAVDF